MTLIKKIFYALYNLVFYAIISFSSYMSVRSLNLFYFILHKNCVQYYNYPISLNSKVMAKLVGVPVVVISTLYKSFKCKSVSYFSGCKLQIYMLTCNKLNTFKVLQIPPTTV